MLLQAASEAELSGHLSLPEAASPWCFENPEVNTFGVTTIRRLQYSENIFNGVTEIIFCDRPKSSLMTNFRKKTYRCSKQIQN
jgi:hypothetical protein